MRVLERVLAILTIGVGSVWAIYVLAFGSDAGLTVPVLLTLVWGGAGVLAVWCVRVGLHFLNTRGMPGQRRLGRLLVYPAVLVLSFVGGIAGGGAGERARGRTRAGSDA